MPLILLTQILCSTYLITSILIPLETIELTSKCLTFIFNIKVPKKTWPNILRHCIKLYFLMTRLVVLYTLLGTEFILCYVKQLNATHHKISAIDKASLAPNPTTINKRPSKISLSSIQSNEMMNTNKNERNDIGRTRVNKYDTPLVIQSQDAKIEDNPQKMTILTNDLQDLNRPYTNKVESKKQESIYSTFTKKGSTHSILKSEDFRPTVKSKKIKKEKSHDSIKSSSIHKKDNKSISDYSSIVFDKKSIENQSRISKFEEDSFPIYRKQSTSSIINSYPDVPTDIPNLPLLKDKIRSDQLQMATHPSFNLISDETVSTNQLQHFLHSLEQSIPQEEPKTPNFNRSANGSFTLSRKSSMASQKSQAIKQRIQSVIQKVSSSSQSSKSSTTRHDSVLDSQSIHKQENKLSKKKSKSDVGEEDKKPKRSISGKFQKGFKSTGKRLSKIFS